MPLSDLKHRRAYGYVDELTVVIVSHNTCDHLRACLHSVVADSPNAVVVVDNASTDGSVEMVRDEFPDVRLLANRWNAGYGPAANLAVSTSNSKYYLLLNSDTRIQPGSLARLRQFMRAHPAAGVVGPRILNPDGSVQWSCFPFPGTWRWFWENDPIGLIAGRIPYLRRALYRYRPPAEATAVPWVLGAALAIRREALDDVQGFDESFFMYYEEVDLSYRLLSHGWETVHDPASSVFHVGGVSTTKKRVSMLVQNFVSTVHFYRKHYKGTRLNVWLLLLYTKMRMKLWRDRLRLKFSRHPENVRELQESVAAWNLALATPSPRARKHERPLTRISHLEDVKRGSRPHAVVDEILALSVRDD